MVMLISNLSIVTVASVFLGIAIFALQEEGRFWFRVPTDEPLFSLALADCLFRLNAVHQGLVPVLRNRQRSHWVWAFFTAFITSAVLAVVALGLLVRSLALHAIVNYIAGWGLMVGVWILLNNEQH
jgi:hypothetical protein